MRLVSSRPSSTWNSEMISASAGTIWMPMMAMHERLAAAEAEAGDGEGGEEGDRRGRATTTVAVTSALLRIAVQKKSRSNTRR